MLLHKKDVLNWIIVSSVISLLILAYLLVAIPKDLQQDLQEKPLTETSNSGDNSTTEYSKKKSVKIMPSDRIVLENKDLEEQESDDESEENQSSEEDDESELPGNTSDDNDQCPGDEGSDDASDDKGGQQDDDETPGKDNGNGKPKYRYKWEGDNTPPMKWGLLRDSHNDNANERADEVRYDCSGKSLGNPNIGQMNEDGSDDSGDQSKDNGKQDDKHPDKNNHGVNDGKKDK